MSKSDTVTANSLQKLATLQLTQHLLLLLGDGAEVEGGVPGHDEGLDHEAELLIQGSGGESRKSGARQTPPATRGP